MGRFTAVLALIFVNVGNWCASLQGAPPEQPGSFSFEIQRNRFSRFAGMEVENRDGEYLGQVKDFIIDLNTARLAFGVVSVDGFLGLRTTRRIVPAQGLSDATAKSLTLALDISWRNSARIRSSPSIHYLNKAEKPLL